MKTGFIGFWVFWDEFAGASSRIFNKMRGSWPQNGLPSPSSARVKSVGLVCGDPDRTMSCNMNTWCRNILPDTERDSDASMCNGGDSHVFGFQRIHICSLVDLLASQVASY
jgi:hypothetical protein